MLLFLSPFHAPNKVFDEVEYSYLTEKITAVQTNEAAVRALAYEVKKQNSKIEQIFIFISEKLKEELQIGSETKKQKDWFFTRLDEVDVELKGRVEEIYYNEGRTINENIKTIADTVEKIKDYAKQSKIDLSNITLNADITGGPRHSIMMMMGIIQLLKYYKVNTGKIFYANLTGGRNDKPKTGKLEEATDIQRMFNLVSGIEEFSNFGSVEAIEEYFQDKEVEKKSGELEQLLKAMRNFSDAIKLCQTNALEKILGNLEHKIKQFRSTTDKNIQEELFAKILDLIDQEYKFILGRNKKIGLIQWCIKKGFMQQAMTLYTEWIPQYIVANKIFYPTDDKLKLECKKQDRDYKSWEQVLVTDYNLRGCKNDDSNKTSNKFFTKFKNATKELAKILVAEQNKIKLIEEKISQLKYDEEILKNMQILLLQIVDFAKAIKTTTERKTAILEKYPKLKIIVVKPDSYQRSLDEFITDKVNLDWLLNQTAHLGEDKLKELLNVKAEVIATYNESLAQKETVNNIEERWVNRERVLKKLYKDGVCNTNYPKKYLDILKDYFYIRNYRNQINHANDANAGDDYIKEIKDLLNKGLENLTTIKGA